MTDESLKLSSHQASDVEAASDVIYSQAAESVLKTPKTSLGPDMTALIAVFLVTVLYHIQNPLLQFEIQFGQAFRNKTLQPALAMALIAVIIPLVGNWRMLDKHRLRLPAAIILSVYALFMLMAVVFKFNLLGALFSIPQDTFLSQVDAESALRPALQNALTISSILEIAALVSVVALWSPWKRLAVYRKAARSYLPSLVIAFAFLVLWEGLIEVFQIQQFLLPRPSVIAAQFLEIYPRLVTVGWNTFQNAFWGFVVGCGLGILTGLISARFVSFSKALLPLAIAANSVPIIAFAPIFNNWFGALSQGSKIAIVAVLVYFPAMISTVRGLTSVDNLSLELMKSYAASPWEVFSKLRVPTALPYIFSALKVGTTLSMIGSIVSEYFGGSNQGLGYRIREDAALFKYPESWAAIIVASILGILFYMVVSAVERAVMPWHVSFRED